MIYSALIQDPMVLLEALALLATTVFMGRLSISGVDEARRGTDSGAFDISLSNRLETVFDVGKSVFIPKHYLREQRVAAR